MAANCAPPAKTRADMSATSAGDIPLAAATAPNSMPMGRAAIITGAMSRNPARISRRAVVE
jgi:hypothetical protein